MSTMNPKYLVLNSNWKNKIVPIKFLLLLHPDVVLSLPSWLSQFSYAKLRQPTGQKQSNVRMQQKNKINWANPIFIL